jgi:anti-sigma factor RsiW
MNCKQVEELLPLYAGRDLEEKRATLVAEHVQTCAACARVADEYREAVQLSGQFAPPIFSEAVYRRNPDNSVLREIEYKSHSAIVVTNNKGCVSATIPRWAIASVLLMLVSIFAIYFLMNKGKRRAAIGHTPPAEVQPGTRGTH